MKNQQHYLIHEPQSREDAANYTIPSIHSTIYEVKFNDFLTFIGLQSEEPGTINADLYRSGGEHLAYLHGSLNISNYLASFNELKVIPEDASKIERLRYVAEIVAATETILNHQNIEKIIGSTHEAMVHLLERMGWERSEHQRMNTIDMEKNLKEHGVILPESLF